MFEVLDSQNKKAIKPDRQSHPGVERYETVELRPRCGNIVFLVDGDFCLLAVSGIERKATTRSLIVPLTSQRIVAAFPG